MNQFRKLLSGLVALSTVVSLTGIGMSSVSAAQLTSAKATLDDPSSGVSTSYTFDFFTATAGNIESIDFQFANSASQGATVPTTMDTTSATLSSVTDPTTTPGWTVNNATNGKLKLTRGAGAASYSAASHLIFTFGGIHSNTTTGGSQCDAVTDSDSCFVRIYTYAASADEVAGTPIVDTTTITYTIVNPITVSATVDPILIFTVSGVLDSALATNDGKAGAASNTTVTSTSTTMPFGHLTVGQKILMQQKLSVETNANNGYNVYNRFLTSNYLVGSANSSNHFSPFTEASASWSVPQPWATPSGTTANTNTAEIGLRTTDTAVSGGGFNVVNALGYYGPPTTTPNGNLVKTSTIPDNGASGTDKFVTFKIEANAFQPADSYTGSMVYSVVASY